MLQRYKVLLNTHCLDVTSYYSWVISFPSSLATGLLLFTAEDHGIPFGSIHMEFLILAYEREARSLCQYGKNDLKTPVNTHVIPREESLSLDGQPSWKEKLALVGTEDLGWESGTPETRHLPNSQPCLGLVLLREQLVLIPVNEGILITEGLWDLAKITKWGKKWRRKCSRIATRVGTEIKPPILIHIFCHTQLIWNKDQKFKLDSSQLGLISFPRNIFYNHQW